jgi:hypothetical protein
MDLGPGGLNNPGPSGFGGGYNATTSSNTGGNGDNQSIVARPDYVVTNQVTDNNYFTPSRTRYNTARAANFFLNPELVTKFAADQAIKNQYEEELKTAQDIAMANLSGSPYFGAPNRAGMQSYKNIVGGFPNTDPFVNTGGGDNQIIPRMQMIAEAPSDVESISSDFDLYAALEGREGMRFGENPYGIMGVAQRFAEGGEVRQAYGLGKLVRKATKAVKKVLKSDIGKAALLYGAGTYLGGMEAFGGSGISKGTSFGFKNFGKRLFSPTGTDGIANLLNPFRSTGGGYKLPFVQTEQQKSAELAKELGLIEKSALSDSGKEKLKDSLITKSLNIGKSEIPGYVKYGIPAAMLATYGAAKKEEPDDLDQEIAQNYTDNSGLVELYASLPKYRFQVQKPYQLAANGGRMGYEEGGNINPADLPMSREGLPTYEDIETGEEVEYPYENKERSSAPDIDAELFQMYLDAIGSGKIPRSTTFDQYKELMSDRVGAKEGGLMDLGGMEKDYRAEGGFVPIGKAEKADDVPARLSKNEFVFTADAVRNAGGGDVDKGAEVMYNVMKNLESGGKISEKSQGLQGARNMFQTSQKLGEIL